MTVDFHLLAPLWVSGGIRNESATAKSHFICGHVQAFLMANTSMKKPQTIIKRHLFCCSKSKV